MDVFEDFSILAEKQQLKPKKSNSLMNFASLDTQPDFLLARLVEIYSVLHFVLKFHNSSAPYNFDEIPKVMSEGSVYSLVAKLGYFTSNYESK